MSVLIVYIDLGREVTFDLTDYPDGTAALTRITRRLQERDIDRHESFALDRRERAVLATYFAMHPGAKPPMAAKG